MAVRIRLSRLGKKGEPFYRIVAVDSRKKRDGAYLDAIGTYDAVRSTVAQFDEPLYQAWIGKGALPTDSAKKVYKIFRKASAPEQVVQAAPAKKAKRKATE